MTSPENADDGSQIRAIALRRRSAERRREAIENLRRLAAHLETATALERRADSSPSPAVAALLRERAEDRRRIAAVVRAHLAEYGALTVPGPRPPRGHVPDPVTTDTQPMPVVFPR